MGARLHWVTHSQSVPYNTFYSITNKMRFQIRYPTISKIYFNVEINFSQSYIGEVFNS